jgi:hypothetical protein
MQVPLLTRGSFDTAKMGCEIYFCHAGRAAFPIIPDSVQTEELVHRSPLPSGVPDSCRYTFRDTTHGMQHQHPWSMGGCFAACLTLTADCGLIQRPSLTLKSRRTGSSLLELAPPCWPSASQPYFTPLWVSLLYRYYLRSYAI